MSLGNQTTTKIHGINVQIAKSPQLLGKAAANLVANSLRETIQERDEANLILATGASQYEFLDELRKIQDVSWDKIVVFHLDQYLGMASNDPASFHKYLHQRVFQYLPFREIHLIHGDAPDPIEEAQRYSSLLAERVIDVACLGIGENAHLAFNDPPADFNSKKLVDIVELNIECRRQQVGEGHFGTIEEVPLQAITLTIPAMLSAKKISCAVPDRRKAEAVRCALEGPLTPDCPASILRKHPDCHIFLSLESASLLSADLKS